MSAYAEYLSADAHKLLTDNRDLYIAQSARTRDGVVAPFDPDPPSAEEVREAFEFKYDIKGSSRAA